MPMAERFSGRTNGKEWRAEAAEAWLRSVVARAAGVSIVMGIVSMEMRRLLITIYDRVGRQGINYSSVANQTWEYHEPTPCVGPASHIVQLSRLFQGRIKSQRSVHRGSGFRMTIRKE